MAARDTSKKYWSVRGILILDVLTDIFILLELVIADKGVDMGFARSSNGIMKLWHSGGGPCGNRVAKGSYEA